MFKLTNYSNRFDEQIQNWIEIPQYKLKISAVLILAAGFLIIGLSLRKAASST